MFSPSVQAGLKVFQEALFTQEFYTQERSRECCTYPLAPYPLKIKGFFHREALQG